ncbi:myosin-binding protein 7-like [Ananas comosus]|uniref:Myosin-binding protein 7-like n=1 Tax=Ananas comosus TaxID=4615 RepID=A0A6P5F8L4_ANACO|nr:myosin-binding protein 7-like [Ananas comosus]
MEAVAPRAAPCPCACPYCCSGPSEWRRSVKRKAEPDAAAGEVVRVEVENEVAALREAVAGQQETIQRLCAELEEERSASASAASEAMSMILRLQREKAEAQMEGRQFKRFAEEKMAHDQQEIATLEDLLFKRDHAIQSLSSQIEAYRYRLLREGIAIAPPDLDAEYGDVLLTPDADAATANHLFEDLNSPFYDYPPLRCTIPGGSVGDRDRKDDDEGDRLDAANLEKPEPESLRDLEQRILQLEKESPHSSIVMEEKGVVEQSLDGDTRQDFRKVEEFPVMVDRPSDEPGDDDDDDDVSDRVYTIDTVHSNPTAGVSEEYSGSPTAKGKGWEKEGETDIKKLYMRLEVLEADRESMRQAIISMRTEKAQLVLLKEIAQQLSKEVIPSPERRIVKKKSFIESFPIIAVFKWVFSFTLWRKKAPRCRYPCGLSNSNVGLLLLLDKSNQGSQRKFLTRARG